MQQKHHVHAAPKELSRIMCYNQDTWATHVILLLLFLSTIIFGVETARVYKKPSCRQDSRPYCQKLQGSRDLGHAHFQGKFLCACLSFSIQSRVANLKSIAQVVLEICSIVCQKFQASRDLGHAHFCARSAFPIQSCIPNLKSVAQVVFEILRFTRIRVTSLTFHDVIGHVTIRQLTCHFLLLVLWNQTSISNGFRDI